MKSINPFTEEVIAEYPDMDILEVEKRVLNAEKTFKIWNKTPLDQRARLMLKMAELLLVRKETLSRLMVEEVGKTIVSAEAEIEKCAWVCRYYAENAMAFLAPRNIETDATESMVRFEPLGPILAVMPWNFPFWQVFRFAAPSIMAGNVGLLKHASNVCGCALAIERLFVDSQFPEGVFQTLLVPSKIVRQIIQMPQIKAVTLTGSEPAGREVAERAGSVLKKVVLELGGSDPFIILEDADVDKCAYEGARARCVNSGQSCIAAKRFIVVKKIKERFEEALVREMARLKVGDPMDRDTDVGPLARADIVDELDSQVKRTIEMGGKLLYGGKKIERKGFFYMPTVITDCKPGMPGFDEETFGPLAIISSADDDMDAIQLANQSRYGLGASIWTNNKNKAMEMVPLIESGMVFINGPVKSDPRIPFGGIKNSGYGRELSSFGIMEFVNIKTVWVK